jgi:hypothetical protein
VARVTRRDGRVAALLVLTLVGEGVVAGVVWRWVAPQPGYRVAEEGLLFLDPQPEAYVAAEGWFVVVTGVVGLVAGLVVWFRCRHAPWGALIGLFVGGLAGAAATAAVGMLLGRADPWSAPVGSLTQGSLELRAWGVVLVEAGIAVAVWLLLDLLVLPPEEPATEAAGSTDYGAVRDL